MNRLIFILSFLLFLCAFGQNAAAQAATSSSEWSQLGPAVEGSKGFTLYGKGLRINGEGQYELWVKVLPANTPAFISRYDLPRETKYALQYATVDCAKRVLSLDRTAVFDRVDKKLDGRVNSLVPSSKRDIVKPGSISEALYRFVCVESTSLPMTKIS